MAGEIDNFEGIVPEDILNSDDAALKNLASSWGPFQLMGYQCFHLNIKILRNFCGRKSVFYGAKWIKQVYGKSLQQKKYKDAFHLHNTGKKYPKIGPPRTHNRSYVPNGIKFMKNCWQWPLNSTQAIFCFTWALPCQRQVATFALIFCSYLSKRITASAANAASRNKQTFCF